MKRKAVPLKTSDFSNLVSLSWVKREVVPSKTLIFLLQYRLIGEEESSLFFSNNVTLMGKERSSPLKDSLILLSSWMEMEAVPLKTLIFKNCYFLMSDERSSPL